MKNPFKALRAWQQRRFWKQVQLGHLRTLIQEDNRWLAGNPIADALTERYLAALADDWQMRVFEEQAQLRSRLGLDPHELQRAGGSEALWRHRFESAETERKRLYDLVNTPELANFSKAVRLEAAHQVERWGKDNDLDKKSPDWYWLIGHLAGRALEHHKEVERLTRVAVAFAATLKSANAQLTDPALVMLRKQIAHHREKALHHCITTAAALSHWHASLLGLASLNPGHNGARDMAAQIGAEAA
jgi:2-hydroxychromene-2-carboxylate isomerase